MTADHEYDVCLSFAGEQRAYADEVAALLTQEDVRVFYDKYEQANLWGKELYEHLDSIYRERARYCILFISAEYALKVWTNHERKSAQARAIQEHGEYVLPLRFDDTEIPGIRPTVGYVDARTTTAAQLVELVCKKLAGIPSNQDDSGTVKHSWPGVPRTNQEQELLLQTKPRAWEYLLFGSVLVQRRAALQSKSRDHYLRHSTTVRHLPDDREALRFMEDSMTRGRRDIVDSIMRVLDPNVQEWAFGAPGEPGTAERIIHVGERFMKVYEEMFDWATDLRGSATSERLERVFDLAARFMDTPISEVEQFIDAYTASLIGLVDRLNSGEEVQIELQLTVTIDGRVTEECSRELQKINSAINQ